MGLFGQMGDMYRMQKEAKKIKKELASIHIFSVEDGVKVTVNGSQDLINVEIQDDSILQNKQKLEKAIITSHQRAKEKAEKVSAEKMKEIMGGSGGFPGMGT